MAVQLSRGRGLKAVSLSKFNLFFRRPKFRLPWSSRRGGGVKALMALSLKKRKKRRRKKKEAASLMALVNKIIQINQTLVFRINLSLFVALDALDPLQFVYTTVDAIANRNCNVNFVRPVLKMSLSLVNVAQFAQIDNSKN